MTALAKNWHRADVVAALHKRGTSLAKLAGKAGLSASALRQALTNPRTPSNRIIADFLGKKLHELWPQWFDDSGKKLISGGNVSRRNRRVSSQKDTKKLTPRSRAL